MSKNLIPLAIVLTVIVFGVIGTYFLLNQKNINPTDINLNQSYTQPTPQSQTNNPPTNGIINNPEKTATGDGNMDDFQTTQDGLKIHDETVGTGKEVNSGDTVTVHYAGYLENGTKFDSSYDRNTPFTTQIGVGQVIKGWDEGIVGMKVGGKRKLIIPSDLGYGAQGAGNLIPPNSTLVFDVELLDVK